MQEQRIAPYQTDPAWLITASSYLIDRAKPDCERIHLPVRTVNGGTLKFGRGPLPAPQSGRGLMAKRPWKSAKPVAAPHDNVFDLRRNTPTNWAHFLNNHLPLVLNICHQMDLDPHDALLVLPEQTPNYILDAANVFGLTVLATGAAIDGNGILFDVEPWTALRPLRHTWTNHSVVEDALQRLATEDHGALPRRAFLSRRDTRAPTNEAEIMKLLGPLGFALIYPEDLSAADQIRLFQHAETIVAVHGAGLAPLLYARPNGPLKQIIEILHAGHMTDVFRVMAHQVGVNWIGVRGRLKPDYVNDAYDFSQKFRTHSLDNFEVDLTSLKLAFDIAGLSVGKDDHDNQT